MSKMQRNLAIFFLLISPLCGQAIPSTGCTNQIELYPDVCDVRGTHRGYVEWSLQVKDLDQCRDLWVRHSPGIAQILSFDDETRICSNENGFVSDVRKNRTSTTRFFDRKCFNCRQERQNACPVVINAPRIDNGDLELSSSSNPTLIGPWQHGYDSDSAKFRYGIVSPGRNSSKAVQCEVRNGQRCFLGQSFFPYLCSRGLYRIKFDYKLTRNEFSTEQRTFAFLAAGSNYITKVAPDAASQWISHEQYIRNYYFGETYLEGALGVDFYNLKNGNMTLDNLQVEAVPDSFQTIGPSLLVNGGFDSGSFEPWTLDTAGVKKTKTNFSVASPGFSGSSNLLEFNWDDCSGLCLIGGYQPPYFLMFQEFETTPGKLYEVSFNYQLRRKRPGAVDIALFWGNCRYTPKPGYHYRYKRSRRYNLQIKCNKKVSYYLQMGVSKHQRSFRLPIQALTNRTMLSLQMQPGPPQSVSGTIALDNFDVREIVS